MKSLFLLISMTQIALYVFKTEEKQDIVVASTTSCGCASLMPSCCSPEFGSFSCECMAKPACGACPGGDNMLVDMHDSMLKMAMKDAYNQQDLAQKAKLQVELFQKAQEYAKEVGVQEMKAKQSAKKLNESTRKAQYSRAMMFQAASQIRMISDQTVKALLPMKCMGSRCPNLNTESDSLISPNYFISNDLGSLGEFSQIDRIANMPSLSSFGFKQKNLRENDIK